MDSRDVEEMTEAATEQRGQPVGKSADREESGLHHAGRGRAQAPFLHKRQSQGVSRILVPTDFSPASAKALELAAALANQCNATVTILHVVDISAQGAYGTAEELMRQAWHNGATQLGQLAWAYSGTVQAQTLLAEGVPWDVIVEKSHDFDLLVIGRPRSKGMWSLFSHHTAKGVADKAACPVILVNQED